MIKEISGRSGVLIVAMTVGCADPAGAAPIWSLCLAGISSVTPDGVWAAWSLAPSVVVPLALLALWCGHALMRNPAAAGSPDRAARRAAAAIALLLLLAALVSPLCRLAATLTSAHMVQHAVLVALAPPLLVFALRATKTGPRVPLGLFSWTALYGAAIWFWHIPAMYQAALLDPAIHLAMYGSLIAVASAFWAALFETTRGSIRETGAAILALLVTLVHTGILGALLTFSRTLWYPILAPGALGFGLSALDDQQLAGLIMWIPMGAIYMLAAVVLMGARLTQLDRGDMIGGRATELKP